MVRAIPQPKLTPADDLRDKLQRAERAVANLKGMGTEAIALLELLDEAQDLITRLEAKGMDLRPERTRLITVQNQLRSRAAVLVREVAAAGGLAALRRDRSPGRDRWWWYLDGGKPDGPLEAREVVGERVAEAKSVAVADERGKYRVKKQE